MRQRGNGHGWGTNVGFVGLALCIALGAAGNPPRAASGGAGSPEAVDDWWGGIQRQIAVAEYNVTWQDTTYLEDLDAAWQAPNRAHGFRTYFTEDGIRMIPRSAEISWELALALVGYGRGIDVMPVQRASLTADGNRIVYSRREITEWYVNDRRGLEQGFTLEVPPEEIAPAGFRPTREDVVATFDPVFLVLELRGSVAPSLGPNGQSIDFRSEGRVPVLHYSDLVVRDARDRVLPSWMEIFSTSGIAGIRLIFDDRDAAYPVTVDPVATTPSWSADGKVAGDQFGHAVATAGDVNGDGYSDVLVGAPYYDTGLVDAGKVYGFRGSLTGLSAVPDWTQSGIQTEDYFGLAVATAGDVNTDGYADVIVGAPGRDGAHLDEGRALVYHGSAEGLGLAGWQKAGFAQAGAYFGVCVGTAGDVDGDGDSDVIVGALGYDDGAEVDAGAVQVYYGSSSGVSSTASWTTSGGLAGVEYGQGCGTAGDVNGDGYADVIVGADKYPSGGLTESGRVFAYYGSAAGLPIMPDWTRDGDFAGDLFGRRVATVGDVSGDGYSDVVVSAPYYDGNGSDRGRVYVFRGGPAGLATNFAGAHHGEQDDSHYGEAVGPAGDVNGDGYADFIVGAPHLDDVEAGDADVGRAYLYLGRESGPTSTVEWTVTGEGAGALTGGSVGTAGDVNGDGYADIIVGAPGTTVDTHVAAGRAYLYRGSAAGPTGPAEAAYGAEDGEALGYSLAAAGDVNGDGYGDLIVGGPHYDGGLADRGTAVVLHGSEHGFNFGWNVDGAEEGALLGAVVGAADDVDGDGYGDVIISAPLLDAGGNVDSGRVYLYNGSNTGLSATPSWTEDGSQTNEQFGYSAAGAGDVNGDGHSDVIVGSVNHSNGEAGEGGAFVYYGSSLGPSASPDWIAQPNRANAHMGASVNSAGDVNGDGYSDVIVGADHFDGATADGGAAWVYLGASTGLRTGSFWYGPGLQTGGEYGHKVASAGDVNNDGYGDIIVGATGESFGQSQEGRVYVYHGGPSSINGPFWTFESDQADAFLGAGVACAGDVNGDGYADVIVGANGYDNSFLDEGRAWVFLGSPSGLSPVATAVVDGEQADAQLGFSVAGGVDVNGDGYAETLVGAPSWDFAPVPPGHIDVGLVRVYYGNVRGEPIRPRQRRTLTPGPVAHLGATDETDRIGLGALGKTPFGRAQIKYEWEVKPLGLPLDGSATTMSVNWLDTGVAGHDGEVVTSGLKEGAPYHWRMRVHYDPVSVPWQQHGRWFTVPRNGMAEADLRTRCNSAAPSDGSTLSVDKSGSDAVLTWEPVPRASGYDVVSGSVVLLQDLFGNYRHATTRCIGDDISGTTVTDTVLPGSSDGVWYLVRGTTCGGVATYNSGAASQQGSRDGEVNSANLSCP